MTDRRPMFGRLVKVQRHRGDPDAKLYVVAEADPDKAIAIVKSGPIDSEGSTFEDAGRVTQDLIEALKLSPGAFANISKPS